MKFVSLISSGIDSPVATYLISDTATQIVLLHFDITPFSDDRENKKFSEIAKHLDKKTKCRFKNIIVPHGENLEVFRQKCENRFTCIFCKRMMYRIARIIAEKNSCQALITGDSLGQVASQTLQNIKVIEEVSSLPVLRPLIGYDKEEIVDIAKEIGSFKLSIQNAKKCAATPSKPATRAKIKDIVEEEKKIDVKKMVDKSVEKARLVTF
ncbi:MAG: 7-cyano-7-deazaguanine synthase [Candidatus Thermoplasmatota archaeon]